MTIRRMVSLYLAVAAYAALCAVPGEWFWFDPTAPVISDSRMGEEPVVTYARNIHRLTGIRYSAIIWASPVLPPACDDKGGPFDYRPERSGR